MSAEESRPRMTSVGWKRWASASITSEESSRRGSIPKDPEGPPVSPYDQVILFDDQIGDLDRGQLQGQ